MYVGKLGGAEAYSGDGGAGGKPHGNGGDPGFAAARAGNHGHPPETPPKAETGQPGAAGGPCPTTPPDVPPTQITGKLVTSGGMGVPMHDIHLVPVSTPNSAQSGIAPAQFQVVSTNAEGVFVFDPVAAGDYRVTPQRAERGEYWEPSGRSVTKVDGTGIAVADFVRRAGGQFTVTVPVRDQNGDPMAGVQVRLRDNYAIEFLADTGADGNAVFADIWSGHCEVRPMDNPPAGFRWDPGFRGIDLQDGNLTTDPFGLVPE